MRALCVWSVGNPVEVCVPCACVVHLENARTVCVCVCVLSGLKWASNKQSRAAGVGALCMCDSGPTAGVRTVCVFTSNLLEQNPAAGAVSLCVTKDESKVRKSNFGHDGCMFC